MTDRQILNQIDFIHERGLGRGGYKIRLSPSWSIYDDYLILEDLRGTYVNPIGPFKKDLYIYAIVKSADKEYKLSIVREFWESLDEQRCIEMYLEPFLSMLRSFVFEQIDVKTLWSLGYKALIEEIEDIEEKDRFFRIFECIKQKSQTKK